MNKHGGGARRKEGGLEELCLSEEGGGENEALNSHLRRATDLKGERSPRSPEANFSEGEEGSKGDFQIK